MFDLVVGKPDEWSPWRIVWGVIQSKELGWVGGWVDGMVSKLKLDRE